MSCGQFWEDVLGVQCFLRGSERSFSLAGRTQKQHALRLHSAVSTVNKCQLFTGLTVSLLRRLSFIVCCASSLYCRVLAHFYFSVFQSVALVWQLVHRWLGMAIIVVGMWWRWGWCSKIFVCMGEGITFVGTVRDGYKYTSHAAL